MSDLDRLAELEFTWERRREREIGRLLEMLQGERMHRGKRRLIERVRRLFHFEKLHCGGCKEWKPPSEFHRDRRRSTGRRPVCNACEKIHRQRRYWRRPAHFRRIKRNWYRRKVERQRSSAA